MRQTLSLQLLLITTPMIAFCIVQQKPFLQSSTTRHIPLLVRNHFITLHSVPVLHSPNIMMMMSSSHAQNGGTIIEMPAFMHESPSEPPYTRMIVFDKDGTLSDPRVTFRRWVTHMTEHMVKKAGWGNQDKIETVFYDQIGWDKKVNDCVPSALLAAGTWDEVIGTTHSFLTRQCDVEIAIDQVREWHTELGHLHGADSPLIPNIEQMMLQCQSKGYQLAICTSDDRVSTDMAMAKWDITSLIQYSCTGDEVVESKPSRVPLLQLCALANIQPSRCIVVGDTTADTGMARNAGAGWCIGVLTGSGTASQLLTTGADQILNHVGMVPSILPPR